MKQLLFVKVCVLSLLFCACRKDDQPGPVVTKSRALSGFTAISSEISGKVEIRTAAVSSVTVQAPSNVASQIHTEVNNKRLKISSTRFIPADRAPLVLIRIPPTIAD